MLPVEASRILIVHLIYNKKRKKNIWKFRLEKQEQWKFIYFAEL